MVILQTLLARCCGTSQAVQRSARALFVGACLLLLCAGARAQTTNAQQPAQANAPAAEPPVVAVIHRLSGWPLQALLARTDAQLPAPAAAQFTRTNIVAGYVLPDGRSVVVRLPRADAEVLSVTARFADFGATPAAGASLLIVRRDGTEFQAKFVGFDAVTGVSLLEAERPVMPPDYPRAPEAMLTLGVRVRVVAPVPTAGPDAADPASAITEITSAPTPVAAATVAAAAAAAAADSAATAALVPGVPTVAPAMAPPPSDDAPVGEAGVIYMNMSEAAGRLTAVRRSPTGRAFELMLDAPHMSPEWTGGVVVNDAGALVGIVTASDVHATRLVSAEAVRNAAARVQVRRASVPQPWLGARGDAVALTSLDALLLQGWPAGAARALLSRPQGVLLTEVAPGTPAARAGLRPGDVVARISQHDVRSIEDMSLLLQEVGGNAVTRFTVLRAQSAPLNLTVRLSAALNPALETAQAEAFAAAAASDAAARAAVAATADVRRAEAELHRAETELAAAKRAGPAGGAAAQHVALSARARAAQRQVAEAQAHFAQAQQRSTQANAQETQAHRRRLEAEARIRAAGATHLAPPAPALFAVGLETAQLGPTGQPAIDGRARLVVVRVRPDSVAARAGFRTGDILETLNGQPAGRWRLLDAPAAELGLTFGLVRDGHRLTIKLPPQRGR